MEFWGVEVKSGEPLLCFPGDDKIVHLSMACLGDVNKDKGSEAVSVYVKFDGHKHALGTLSSDKFPQISYDLIFEKEFELSHNWKHGSVFFNGFKAESQAVTDDDEDSDDFDGEAIPIGASNGKPEIEVKNSAKPNANEAKQKEKIAVLKKNENNKGKDAIGEDEEDSSESDSDNTSEDEPMANGGIDTSEDDDDSDDDDDDEDDDEDDEETPKKTEGSNKRVLESPKNTPVPVKKAKFVTPQKTDSKNVDVAHVATPYPKQAGKPAASNKQPVKQQTPKSGGDYSCKPCNRSFKTEDALGSHNKAKHSATK